MIHYHGLPISPAPVAYQAVKAGHAFVSFSHPVQLGVAVEYSSSFAVDNGAFSAWRSGSPIKDWAKFYAWALQCMLIPSCDFAVIPDVIDGSEADNDALIEDSPLPNWFGAPVWHMHESLDRLERLHWTYPRICIGSSAQYAKVGDVNWWARMGEAFPVICDEFGRPRCKVHGLRMLNPKVFTKLPFASADSTSIGRGTGIDQKWKGTYQPPTKEARATVMRARIEAHNAPPVFSADFTSSTTETI